MLAHFGRPCFPFAFMGQRIGIGTPQLFDHFALRDEGALGLGIPVHVVELLQRQLRAGHHHRFLELLVEAMRGVVERPQRSATVLPQSVG
jgi:hypothetical protein